MPNRSSSRPKPLVSILTPTIEVRRHLLDECRASVKAQTFLKWEHIVQLDKWREGCAGTMNKAARAAEGDWLLPLADDDLLLPGCLRVLLAHSEQADVVYSPPLVWGEDGAQFCASPPFIPAVALIRKEVWGAGYDETLHQAEDQNLWIRLQDAGLRFVRAGDEPTWVYRFHGGNKSRHDGQAT